MIPRYEHPHWRDYTLQAFMVVGLLVVLLAAVVVL